MSTIQAPAPALLPLEAAPVAPSSFGTWLRRHFFSGPVSAALTLALVLTAALAGPALVRWAVIDAVFLADNPSACRAAQGACWAVVVEKYRLILFGTYPYGEQWRGGVVVLLLVGMGLVSTIRSLWSMSLLLAWAAILGLAIVLQLGGVFGLSTVATSNWGGLPLTLLLFAGTVAIGLPLAILLALGRKSEFLAIRGVSTLYVEVVRGIPLVNVLFMAALMFPLFVPEGMNLDKLLRAQLGLIMFFGAYTAEVVRGGLLAIPRSQYEAADSLGVSYWERTRRIILPQALRIVIPALVNDMIRAFKNTSLLAIIGLLDLLGGTMAALQDPDWSRYYLEAYLFTAAIYFAFCFAMSRYSQRLERDLSKGRNL